MIVDTSPLLNGTLVDGIVEGIAYSTSSGLTGFTDKNGGFNYYQGDQITFSIGNVVLGSFDFDAAADGNVFLQEIAGTSLQDVNDEYVENMAVLLQTLDANGNAYDGISITPEMHALFSGNSFDLSTISGDQLAQILVENGFTPISEDSAMQHVQDMIVGYTDLEDGDFDMRIVDAESDDGMLDYAGFDFDMTDESAEDIINIQIQDLVDTEGSGAIELASESDAFDSPEEVTQDLLAQSGQADIAANTSGTVPDQVMESDASSGMDATMKEIIDNLVHGNGDKNI